MFGHHLLYTSKKASNNTPLIALIPLNYNASDNNKRLDRQSRFVLQLLQTFI
jgi:hypothetical protein